MKYELVIRSGLGQQQYRRVTKPKGKTIHVSLGEALAEGPPRAGNLAVPIFNHGTLEAELYAPKGDDHQKPHTRDEIYVVGGGTGLFFDGESRVPVGPGAFIFVPAGQLHRFEEFSDDFAVWVFFYGPEGGEAALSE